MKRNSLSAVRTWVMLPLLAAGAVVLTSCWRPTHMRRCCHPPVSTQPVYTEQKQPHESACEPSKLPVSRVEPPYPNPLPVAALVQEGLYSCWATSAEMIMYFHGLHVPQCVQASPAGEYECWCCVGGRLRDECDQAGYPNFQRWGFSAGIRYQTSPLSWAEATKEINEGRPFAFVRTEKTKNASMAHMMVAIGYEQPTGPETQALVCLNPRSLTFAHEEKVMFHEYRGINNQTGGLTPPKNPLSPTPNPSDPPKYIHEMTYTGIQWSGGAQ